MKKEIMTSLYFNKDFGFINSPVVKLVNPPLWHSMDFSEKLELNISASELGQSVFKTLCLERYERDGSYSFPKRR